MSNDNFAQDVTDSQLNGNAENGGGDGHQESNSAETLGRDDDRYILISLLTVICIIVKLLFVQIFFR